MISIDEAYERLQQNIDPLPAESIRLDESVGRVLSGDVNADVHSPPHDKSVMDGYAIRSADIAAGQRRLRVVETITAGDVPVRVLKTGEAAKIMTGAPLPEGADAVVMIEQTTADESDSQDWVTIQVGSVAPEKHVLRRGVNFKKGQAVLASGHVVRPTDIGLLAEVGAVTVKTGGTPSVAVLPTGNELVDCGQVPGAGQIRNSNGPLLVSMARGLGLEVTDLGVGRDDPVELRKLIQVGLKHDLLLLSGGVSAGTLDLVPGILKELGVEEVFHKVYIKPGKPIWFGVLKQGTNRTYVFGLPGNPVSSLVGFQIFVRAAIRKLMGGQVDDFRSLVGVLSEPHETRGGRPTYWPAKYMVDDGPLRKFCPLLWRGSSDLFALGEADGLIYFPADTAQHPAGEEIRFLPFD